MFPAVDPITAISAAKSARCGFLTLSAASPIISTSMAAGSGMPTESTTLNRRMPHGPYATRIALILYSNAFMRRLRPAHRISAKDLCSLWNQAWPTTNTAAESSQNFHSGPHAGA